MRHFSSIFAVFACAAAIGCAQNDASLAAAGHSSTDQSAPVDTAAQQAELDLEATSTPLAGTTSTYYVVYGKPNASLQLCSTKGCASEGFYLRYNESNNEFRLVSRHGSTYNDRLVVERDSGNVGIGTNSPSQKLDVNGTIRAKRIVVENTTADYVFEKGYDLPTLAEVEDHISQYGHLPDVPNAAQVKAEGSDLAKTQTLLLQKIEELTLYTIAQNKQLAQQARRIAQLEGGASK